VTACFSVSITDRMRWKLPTFVMLVVVLVLAVGGALVGLVVHGVPGAAFGAAVVALSGVSAGYVPLFRDRAKQYRADLKRDDADRMAAKARLSSASEPALEGRTSGPSLLLRPELAVVEFAGRQAELTVLRSWCAQDNPRSVCVLWGAGGVGKTRLALKIAAEWEAAGRTHVSVASGQESDVLAQVRGVASGPVLLTVDYAEARAGLGDLLRAVLDDTGPVRVLLLARALGEWWVRLAEESAPAVAQLLSETDPIHMDAPIEDVSDRDLATSALPYFAMKLRVAVPARVEFQLPPQRVPVLVLHTAALVAVLRSMTSPPGPSLVGIQGVLGELLEHEARYWRRTAKSAGLTADGPVLKAVAAAAILLGAGDLTEAAAVAGRVPDLAGARPGDLRRWGRWLYGLYPGDSAGRLGSVQPDLLAESHVMAQLGSDLALARALLDDLTPGQAERALTVLVRAWDLHDSASQVIGQALRAHLVELAIPAANVALQTSHPIGDLLAQALSDAPATLEDLTRIEEALPYPSIALAQADLAAAQRIRQALPPGADRQTIARWANRCGELLAQVGRPADALAPAQEAVTMRREMAAAAPKRYRPDLAESLTNLGICFSGLGRPADALAPAQEAVAIHRELAVTDPDRYRPDLASSLKNLGIWLWELRRPALALPPMQEAVAILRDLAAVEPDQYRADLADALNNLGTFISVLGRPEEAPPPAQEAVSAYRELAAADPDRYRPQLALALNNLSLRLTELGRLADAAPATQEALAILRDLAATYPDMYRPQLAVALHNLSRLFSTLRRPADALPPAQEAVAIRRELAATDPGQYRTDLAQSLENLGHILRALGLDIDAATASIQAVTVRSQIHRAAN
jgi:tetratricopeptide (TPR) repeat protein